MVGMKKLIDIWRDNQDLDVIIGDACSEVCYPASLLASVWNIPIISWSCTSQALSDKTVHPTFSRLMRPSFDTVKMVKDLVIMFGWKRIGILSDHFSVYKEQSRKLYSDLQLINITVFYYNIISIEKKTDNLKKVMKSIKEEVRVLIIYSYGLTLEEMSLLVKNESMEKGYVFIVASDNAFNSRTAKDYLSWLTLTVALPDWNKEEIILDFNDPSFKEMNNSSSNRDEELFSFAGKYYFPHSNTL